MLGSFSLSFLTSFASSLQTMLMPYVVDAISGMNDTEPVLTEPQGRKPRAFQGESK